MNALKMFLIGSIGLVCIALLSYLRFPEKNTDSGVEVCIYSWQVTTNTDRALLSCKYVLLNKTRQQVWFITLKLTMFDEKGKLYGKYFLSTLNDGYSHIGSSQEKYESTLTLGFDQLKKDPTKIKNIKLSVDEYKIPPPSAFRVSPY